MTTKPCLDTYWYMHKVGLAITEDMYQALEKEKKRRQLASIPELVRVLIGESLLKDQKQ
jgi:hypothetical protein